ncbi:AAEL011236-PA, partial [Aedes aegypti]
MSSVSDSQSSGSESDSTTDDELSITPADRDSIFKDCIRNLEECVIRFPEHYKSIYRLAYHYLNAPGETKSLERCNQLLLGSYKAALGNHVAGLFTERRSNNFFNGIWRIPSSDIDRPGSFSTHLAKCVAILIETLKRNDDHETLLELAIQLYRRPDSD